MSQYCIAKFNKNWVDKFDCDGFSIHNKSVEEVRELIKEKSDEQWIFGFGTNEGWEGNYEKDYITEDDFVVEPLTEVEYGLIKKTLGTSCGISPL